MNREIKFRAWTGENMISPDYISRDGFAYYKENSIPSKVNTIMQFTGLKDKNGVDIYEGDIIRYVIPQDFITEYFSEVKFIEKESKYYPLACCGKNFEVVGNIYENPELLNK